VCEDNADPHLKRQLMARQVVLARSSMAAAAPGLERQAATAKARIAART
jgi:hypothetical protein